MSKLSVLQVRAYAAAIAFAVIAMGLSLVFSSIIKNTPSLLFFGAVTVSAAYCGLWPSLLTTILSVVFLSYFLPPYREFTVNADGLSALLVFAAMSIVMSTLYERRKRAEGIASDQRETQRITLNSIGDGVITTDTQAVVTFLNPVAEQLTGWRLADAQKQDIQTVFKIVNEHSRQTTENPVFKVIAQGLTVGLANHTVLIARDGSELAIDDSAAPIKDADGVVTGVVLTFRDITERRRTETTQQLLIKVGDWLAAVSHYNNYDVGLSELTTVLGSQFADWNQIALMEAGKLVEKALVHCDPSQQPLLEQFYKQLPDRWTRIGDARHLDKTYRAAIDIERFIDADTAADTRHLLRTLNPTAELYVPLFLNNELLGVLSFYRCGKRSEFSQIEADFAEEVARRMATAIDNNRLYQQAKQARQVAEHTALRLARTQEITAALNRALLPMDVAKTIVDQTIASIDGAYGSLIAIVDEDERKLNVTYGAGYSPEAMSQFGDIRLDRDRPLSQMVRDGQPLFIATNADWLARFPKAEPWLTSQSLAVIPLLIERKAIGCLIVSFNVEQSFPEADRAFLLNVANKCGQSLQRVQLYAAEKQAREQIDAIMESISDGFYSFDRTLHYTFVNSKGALLAGALRNQLIGKRIHDMVPPDRGEPFIKQAERALNENAIVEYENYSPERDQWVNVRLYPYSGGLTAYVQDISPRKKAEADALLHASQLKSFIEAGVIGVIFAKNDGQITDANDKFLQMVGYSRTDLEQGKLNSLPLMLPDYALQEPGTMVTLEENGQPSPVETECIHKDGHRIPILIGAVPVQDTLISFVLDLTERKRAENRLNALTEASAMLATSLDYRTTLSRVAQSMVPVLADWCTIHLKEPDGTVEQVALAHRDPAKIAWAYQIQQDYPDDPNAKTGIFQVIRSGQAEFYPEITDEMMVVAANNDAKLLRLLREIGYSAAIIVPLKVQDQVVGAIQLVSAESRQRYAIEDLRLAEDIARRAAIAIDNAQLYNQVHQERERLQVTLSSIGDAVIAADIHGIITFVNTIAETLTGWSMADAVGTPLNQVFRIVNANTNEDAESPIEKVLREGRISNLSEHTVLIAKDNTHIPIDDSAAPIRNANNELIGMILVFRDIRIRREAEQQKELILQRTSDLYNTSREIGIAGNAPAILNALLSSRYLQQTSYAAIIIFNQPWKTDDPPTTFEIAASLKEGVPPGFASNHSTIDSPLFALFSRGRSLFVHDMIQDHDYDPSMRTLFIQHNVASFIMLPLWAGGACFGLLALYSASPKQWSRDDFEHIRIFADQVAIVMDNVRLFDAERAARQEAEHANALRLKFLAMISHELRTPLTSIKGFTTSLLAPDVTWDADNQTEFINIIDEEADKLTDLISQLLDLSQLQAGTLRIRPVARSLSQIVEIAKMQLIMLTNNHHLVIEAPPDLPLVMVDPQRIAQVLTNLVGNAVKYAPEGTNIAITATVAMDSMKIDVRDEGPGIPPEKHEMVFEAFQQLEQRALEPLKGAGLGLAICKGLVEANHGRIWIADTPQVGTTISFTLPLA